MALGLHLRLGLASGGGGSIVLDPDAEALIAAMTPTPNAGRQILINNLILQLKADGIWTLLDLLYVFAAHAQQPATLNWKNPATFTNAVSGGPTFTVDRGFTGNGVGAFLSPGWGLASNGVQAQQNSTHLSGWSLTSGAASNTDILVGNAATVTADILLVPRGTGDVLVTMINDSTASAIANTNKDGFFVGNRSAAGARQGYRNGASLGSDTIASIGEADGGLTFLRYLTNFSTLQISQASVGASLNAGQVSDFYDALLTYMIAVGAVVAGFSPSLDFSDDRNSQYLSLI